MTSDTERTALEEVAEVDSELEVPKLLLAVTTLPEVMATLLTTTVAPLTLVTLTSTVAPKPEAYSKKL